MGDLQFDDSELQPYRDGMSPVVSTELGEHIRDVALDRVLCNGELGRDLFVRVPGRDRRSTSISRELKSSSPVCSASSAATSGGIRFWPAWTARMVSRSSLRTCVFNM